MSTRVEILQQLKEHPLTHPSHLFTHLQTPSLSLSTSQEQGRTLELERERNEEKIEGGKEEEEEKHRFHQPLQHSHGELKRVDPIL